MLERMYKIVIRLKDNNVLGSQRAHLDELNQKEPYHPNKRHCTNLLICLLGLFFLLACNLIAPNQLIAENSKVIYGPDDRLDEYQVTDTNILGVGDSTCVHVLSSDITDNGDGTFTLASRTFNDFINAQYGGPLCADEPFRDQPNPGCCSGFLVAPNIVATAGHCIENAGDCSNAVYVFGFVMTDATTPVLTIDQSEIYYCDGIIDRSDNPDWALIQLDREVTNHNPLEIRTSGKVADGQDLLVIGHPVGLPQKYANNATVSDNSPSNHFEANLDTYMGNSGSAVFNADTLVVEGILVLGQEDFVQDGNCWRSNECPDTGCGTGNWESVTRTTAFSSHLLPDLTISSSDISFNPPGPVEPGTQIEITATIHNEGGTDTTCDVWIYYDDQSIGACVTIEDFYGISVEAGGTTDIQTTWDTTGLETTIYPVCVVISNSDPEESNTDNNDACSDYALPVELSAFSTMKQVDGTVLIRWQTASETLNEGWNILRRPAGSKGAWEKLNTNNIVGAGTAPFGETYEFIDDTAKPKINYFYALEWISTKGKVERSPEVLLGDRLGDFIEAQTEETKLDADAISINTSDDGADTNWRTAYNSADYVIITPRALVPAVRELAEFRRHQGRQVKIVAVEDIYALFPKFSGEKAIRQFLMFAYNHWAPPKLRYVLLVGDAVMTSDYNQTIYRGLLPTFIRKMPGVGFIPTDYPYACLTGADHVPELVVGRLPVRSPAELKSMVKKIIRHELSPPNRNVVFANGDYVVPGDEYAETSSEAIISDFCEDVYDVTRIYTMPVADSLQQYQGGADDLAAVFKEGCSWLEFRGHGAASLWAGLLGAKGAKTITNSQLPIVTSVSCFTGFFTDPKNRMCMAEALLKNPVGGAVAYLGNTGHGMVFAGHDFSVDLWENLNDGNITIGDAVFNAKKSLAEKRGDRGFLHSINLFGDPTTTIKLK